MPGPHSPRTSSGARTLVLDEVRIVRLVVLRTLADALQEVDNVHLVGGRIPLQLEGEYPFEGDTEELETGRVVDDAASHALLTDSRDHERIDHVALSAEEESMLGKIDRFETGKRRT